MVSRSDWQVRFISRFWWNAEFVENKDAFQTRALAWLPDLLLEENNQIRDAERVEQSKAVLSWALVASLAVCLVAHVSPVLCERRLTRFTRCKGFLWLVFLVVLRFLFVCFCLVWFGFPVLPCFIACNCSFTDWCTAQQSRKNTWALPPYETNTDSVLCCVLFVCCFCLVWSGFPVQPLLRCMPSFLHWLVHSAQTAVPRAKKQKKTNTDSVQVIQNALVRVLVQLVVTSYN